MMGSNLEFNIFVLGIICIESFNLILEDHVSNHYNNGHHPKKVVDWSNMVDDVFDEYKKNQHSKHGSQRFLSEFDNSQQNNEFRRLSSWHILI